jgi:APA family basic amino acid/polyamine antiporter
VTAAAIPTPGQLQLRLGIAFALAVSVGNIIGSGIMRTPGLVADQVPSAWMLIALWLFGGLHTLLLANVASELITSIPKAGGSFVPVRAAFGETMGLLAGWTEWLARVGAIAALSAACANFVAMIFPAADAWAVPIAAAFALSLVALNWPGVREGQVAQITGSLLKVGLIVGVIIVAFVAEPIGVGVVVERANAVAESAAPTVGFVALIGAYQLIYGAYSGWQAPCYFVEEDANAVRNIPRALAVSILLVTAIYVALNLSLLAALDMAALRASDLPVALVIENAFGQSGGVLVALLAIVIVVVAINALVMSTSRILYGMARDGLFLSAALRVNKGGTPDIALAITTVLTLMLILSGGFVFLFKLMAALASLVFLIYSMSLFGLRRKFPDLPRPFRAIGYPLLPALACLLNFGLLIAFIAAEPVSGLYMLALIAICVPVGLVLQRRRKDLALKP